MKAIDTNVVVRLLTGDDEAQLRAAASAIAGGVFVSSGVLIETEWVLRSGYAWPRDRIAAGLRRLLHEPQVTTANGAGLSWALDRYAAGADWADMLHLVDAAGQDGFLTFDRRLARMAQPAPPVPVEVLA